MPPEKYCSYSKEDLQNSLQAIKNGMPCAVASKLYNVPRTTLIGKIKGTYPEECKSGVSTVLTSREEDILVNWILSMAKMGFPINKDQLLDSVTMLCRELKRHNKFNDGRPGRHWFEGFLKRHPQISLRMSENLTASRAAVTEASIKNWFDEVKKYFISTNTFVNDPNRIFNADESAFFLSPKGNAVLAKKGSKTVYEKSGNEKECLTVLITGNANGVLAPPMVMYPYDRIPKHIVMRVSNGWGIGKSDSGWMTSESFFEYISNIFYPWIVSMNIELPILLYVDGHKSHITLSLSRFCTEKQIILICLPPNTTHILQPLDVELFRSLKQSWKKCIKSYRVENGFKILNRENFAPVLKMALEDVTNMKNIFQNSFRVCGLYPFEKSNVDYTKVVQKVLNIENISNNPEIKLDIVQHLRYIEDHIENTTLQKFYSLKGGEWDGDMEDRNLYKVWVSIFNKTGLSYDSTANAILSDEVIIEVEEGIDLEREWEALIVETPENDFEQEIFENEKNINIIQNIMLTGPKTDEINEESTDEYRKSKEKPREQDEIEGIEEKTDNAQKNSDEITENIQENKKEDIGVGQDKETNIVSNDSSSSRGNDRFIESKDIKQLKNNEIGETVDKTTVDKIKEAKKVENTEEKTDIAKTEVLKNIDNISPDRTKNNIEKNSTLLVPSPFKKALFWPEATPSKKFLGKKKEKIPSVTTSDAWKEYYSKKEDEKNKQLEEKENRKRKRAAKNIISKKRPKKTKLEQQNSSENEEVLPNVSEDDGEVCTEKVNEKRNFKIGDFVIVIYENDYYPGNVTGIEKEKILINSMTRSGSNWKWPDEKDEIWYDFIEVLEVIQPPKKINKRGCFQVEEINMYSA